jgi:hypothetical protein
VLQKLNTLVGLEEVMPRTTKELLMNYVVIWEIGCLLRRLARSFKITALSGVAANCWRILTDPVLQASPGTLEVKVFSQAGNFNSSDGSWRSWILKDASVPFPGASSWSVERDGMTERLGAGEVELEEGAFCAIGVSEGQNKDTWQCDAQCWTW